ncbi:MAG: GNAT family N-acetyltransferase [Gammaproteobacteria bacterium]|nr:GNAT family N-acetyltransferase [Gammaproteobacteria bacterium]
MIDAAVRIRAMLAQDVVAADRVLRVAFGTHMGLAEPAEFMGDAAYFASRRAADPDAAFVAEFHDQVIGSSFLTRWGSFAFVGPVTVAPEYWGLGVASRLMEPVVALIDHWQITQAGLFTFADSAKHQALYAKFGFRPRRGIQVMEKTVCTDACCDLPWVTWGEMPTDAREDTLLECRRLTDRIYPGLDVTREVESIGAQYLGDTVLLGNGEPDGFAACHLGPGSEAGSGHCYIKFGAASPGRGGRERLRALLQACEQFAARSGATYLTAGVSDARTEVRDALDAAGFNVALAGIGMHRPDLAAFCEPGAFVIDDWR